MPPFISEPAQPPASPCTVILPPDIFSPRCIPALPFTMISPFFIPKPIRRTSSTSPFMVMFGASALSSSILKRSASFFFLLPSQTSNASISSKDLPLNTSGLMHSAITGNWNCLKGVSVIILNVRLHRYGIRNFNVMVRHWIVLKLNSPVLLELSFELIVHLDLLRSLHIQPNGSAVSVLNYFAVLHHDSSVFNGVGSVTKSSPHSFVLYCNVDFFWIHIVYSYVSVGA